jgi:hypothetical protein
MASNYLAYILHISVLHNVNLHSYLCASHCSCNCMCLHSTYNVQRNTYIVIVCAFIITILQRTNRNEEMSLYKYCTVLYIFFSILSSVNLTVS